LDHHENFEQLIKRILDKQEKEKDERVSQSSLIKDELHGRINKIIFSVLGGSIGIILMMVVLFVQQVTKN
jgi:hypothetical protein